MNTLLELFFLPPMAIARLGSSRTPVECFHWDEGITPQDPTGTVVVPATTLKVDEDGGVSAYLPQSIRFKEDSGEIRPVAPFFELWARLQSSQTGSQREVPVTLSLLHELGVPLDSVCYEITAANRKAARRMGSAAGAFIARLSVYASDHRRHELLAISPHTSDQEPLVYHDKPIPLGWFQATRPVQGKVQPSSDQPEVDLGILRVRFTPPAGKVYGPPTATHAAASPLQPGISHPPDSQYGRIHEIVRPENRFLNPNTPWSSYAMATGLFEDPQPTDGYEGALVGNGRSWGVVDDTSDAVIVATLSIGGELYRATARVFTGPPDFAPDRRPLYSISDDLADRDLPPPPVESDTFVETQAEVVDLFQRAFETASLINLDAARARALEENKIKLAREPGATVHQEPKIGPESMTPADLPYIDKIPQLMTEKWPSTSTKGVPYDRLPFTNIVSLLHAPITDPAVLLNYLRRRAQHIKRLIRPPFGAVSEMSEDPRLASNERYRDPRILRDRLHDMRMPPYMRDSNTYPLSLTRRQYRTMMAFIEMLAREQT
jgi:hypothetical protein